jgi:hypothetical protein
MKRTLKGLYVLDSIDVFLLAFSFGGTISYFLKRKNRPDPLIKELKDISRIRENKRLVQPFKPDGSMMNGKLLGGREEGIKGIFLVSILIKNPKFVALITKILKLYQRQKKMRFFFALFNALIASSVGIKFAAGGGSGYLQILLIVLPSSISGFLLANLSQNPLSTIFLPLLFFLGRDIETIVDPELKCRILCKFSEVYHNKQILAEMKNITPLLQEIQEPLVCVEQRLSLIERYKLRQLTKNTLAKNRIKHFSEFIKKFPDCVPDLENLYQEIFKEEL